MNFPLFLPLIVTAALAVVGWYAVHRLSMNRDQENKRRELRIQYLLEAYRRFENSSNRRDLSPYARDLESALADIQLLGNKDQVQLAHEFAVSMAKDQTASLDPLVANIRSELRRELGLDSLTNGIVVFRHDPKTR
ncbi:MAG: hypothetical protein WBE45_14110 [Terriglobales bacterium]|jgi:hypothetical protein